MASPLERREREKNELRTKILDAARELFVSEGYEAVTMRKVAERIEYSPTAIYLYFKDKDALIRDLCVHDFASFATLFAEAAAVEDPIERLRKAAAVYFAFAQHYPQQYRFMFMTPRPPVEPEGDQAADPAQNAYVFLRATIEEAMARGRLRPEHTDAELVAQTIWAATHGVASLEIAHGCEKGWVAWRPIEDRIRMMVDLVLRAFSRVDPARERRDEPVAAASPRREAKRRKAPDPRRSPARRKAGR
jgi:AcrR family transcriptional regulator